MCGAKSYMCGQKSYMCGKVIYVRLSLYVCGINNIITVSLKVCYLCADNKSANGHPYRAGMIALQMVGFSNSENCNNRKKKTYIEKVNKQFTPVEKSRVLNDKGLSRKRT